MFSIQALSYSQSYGRRFPSRGSDPALTRARLEALRATLEEELMPFLHPGIESGYELDLISSILVMERQRSSCVGGRLGHVI